MAIIAGLGAIVIGLSVVFHTRIPTRVSPIALNEHQPSKVLVAVEGKTDSPAFIGLLAVVDPHSDVLSVVPIKGTTKIHGMPLYLALNGTKPKAALALISAATGIPIHRYFFMTSSDLTMVLDALYYHTRHWPKTETPAVMASTLGYPYGQTHGWAAIHLLSKIISNLPGVSPIAASHLLRVTQNSETNLTASQLFLLANYIRGDRLQLGYTSQYRTPSRRHHG
jgi:hypothetical protein